MYSTMCVRQRVARVHLRQLILSLAMLKVRYFDLLRICCMQLVLQQIETLQQSRNIRT